MVGIGQSNQDPLKFNQYNSYIYHVLMYNKP